MDISQEVQHISFNDNSFGGIYLITNTLNGKVYVGKVEFPKTVEDRWKEHLREGKVLNKKRIANPHKNYYTTHIQNAMAKYENRLWCLKTIDIADSKEELNKKETFWIVFYKSHIRKFGYNLTFGGDGGKPTKEVLEKIRRKALARCQNPAYREKISNSIIKKYETDYEYRENQKKGCQRFTISNNIRKIDLKELIIDVKNRLSSIQLEKKYKKAHMQLYRRLEIFLGTGINNLTKARFILDKMEITESDTKKYIKRKAQEIVRKTGILKWEDEKMDNALKQEKSNMKKEYWKKRGVPNFYLCESSSRSCINIQDLQEFLADIKNNMTIKELKSKYHIKCHKTIYSRIQEFLGGFKVTNLLQTREFLKDKDVNELIKSLKPNDKESQKN